MTALEIRDLDVHIDGTPVLHGVGLTVGSGERVGLIGESGSGKSMTALATLGLLPEGAHAGGSVRLCGQEVLGMPERKLAALRGAQVAMVFQEPMTALDPLMRVGDQVAEAVRRHQPLSRRQADAKAVELLRTVHLPDPQRAAAAYPHQLSGGQRQRVVLAMAVANEPAVLICDEPTTALDVTVQRRILDLVGELVSTRDTALLFITHDLAVISQVCDRVVVMYGGRVVETGDVSDVFTAPDHPYTAGLLAASDVAAATPGTPLPVVEWTGRPPGRTADRSGLAT